MGTWSAFAMGRGTMAKGQNIELDTVKLRYGTRYRIFDGEFCGYFYFILSRLWKKLFMLCC
jgi:hypothetical protein